MIGRHRAALAARICLVLAVPLLLSACSGLQSPFQPSAPGVAAQTGQAASPAVQTAAMRTPAAVRANPNNLIGLDRAAVTGLLGTPGFVRRDRAAQMWRYIDDSCVLDLYLYARAADEPETTASVQHYDVRSRNARPVTSQACVGALLSRAPSTS